MRQETVSAMSTTGNFGQPVPPDALIPPVPRVYIVPSQPVGLDSAKTGPNQFFPLEKIVDKGMLEQLGLFEESSSSAPPINRMGGALPVQPEDTPKEDLIKKRLGLNDYALLRVWNWNERHTQVSLTDAAFDYINKTRVDLGLRPFEDRAEIHEVRDRYRQGVQKKRLRRRV